MLNQASINLSHKLFKNNKEQFQLLMSKQLSIQTNKSNFKRLRLQEAI